MKSDKKLGEIVRECYVELYKASTPSADFEELVANAPTNEQGQKVVDYMAYEISKTDFDNVVDLVLAKHKVTKNEKHRLMMSIYLGCSPKYKKENG